MGPTGFSPFTEETSDGAALNPEWLGAPCDDGGWYLRDQCFERGGNYRKPEDLQNKDHIPRQSDHSLHPVRWHPYLTASGYLTKPTLQEGETG